MNRQYNQCWDCDSERFRLFRRDGQLQAECVECGGTLAPERLYSPDDLGKSDYNMEMVQ